MGSEKLQKNVMTMAQGLEMDAMQLVTSSQVTSASVVLLPPQMSVQHAQVGQAQMAPTPHE